MLARSLANYRARVAVGVCLFLFVMVLFSLEVITFESFTTKENLQNILVEQEGEIESFMGNLVKSEEFKQQLNSVFEQNLNNMLSNFTEVLVNHLVGLTFFHFVHFFSG